MSAALADAPLALADASQRKAADPEASVFVTANAGSGKTKVLIDRVARLLLREDDPSAFLCITYTKAAAAEMQRRLFERLGAWCVLDDAALESDLRKLIGPGEKLPPLARARALFAKALETPGGLRIQTIHSFCERLLRRFPLEAEAPPGFEILDEAGADALMASAWRDALARPDARSALAHLARRVAEEALNDMIASINAQRRVLRAMLRDGLAEAIARVRARHDATHTRMDYLAGYIGATPLHQLAAACADMRDARSTDQRAADGFREAFEASADPEKAFATLRRVFLKTDDAPRDSVITKKPAQNHPALASQLAFEQARYVEAVEALKSIDRADDMAALLTLGDALIGGYTKAKKAIGALDFEDLIEHAEALLTRAGATPWVLFKLDQGIDHILIDEGQDTSPTQWDVLAPLQVEFFSGVSARERTRTVFAVGDPKQSIYSFQGADPERFRGEAQALSQRAAIAGKTFHAPDMTMSFRSATAILEAVDSVFDRLPLAASEPDASVLVRHQARRGDHRGVVEFWPMAERPARPELKAWEDPVDTPKNSAVTTMAIEIAAHVSASIRAGARVWDKDGTARAMRAGDVLALVRSRGPVFDALLKAFKSVGLPVAGADRMVLNREIAVLDILAFARAALDPGDDLSLACALKSPLIGLDDDALMELAARRAPGEKLIDRLRAMPIDPAARAIENAIARRDAAPHDFIAALLEERDANGVSGWRRMLRRLGHAARDPLEELLSRALEIGRAGPASLQHFVSAIEQDSAEVKREMEAGHDAVRVMTVHGAKGLEAPLVILADTTRPFEFANQNGLIVSDKQLYWSPNKAGDDALTAKVRASRTEAARREDWRLLYVAMTRARDRLIVCGAERGDQTRNGGRAEGCWHELVEDGLRRMPAAVPCPTPFGEGLRLGADERAPHTARDARTEAMPPRWIARTAPRVAAGPERLAPSRLQAREPPAFAAQAEQMRRFKRGRLIHGLLQRLPDIAPARRQAAGAAWLRARMAPGEDADALIREALAVLNDPRFAAAFGPGSRAEAPLVGTYRGRPVSGVIDRLVANDREVLVLDFKTDRPAPADPALIAESYVAQLALYRAVLTEALPGRAIRCALLWTEAPKLMEIQSQALDRALASLVS